MKVYNTNEIKNIALLGNAGSGKTSLAETMLYYSGTIKRKGSVENQNTTSDYHEVEHSQENSVFSSLLYAEWQGKKLNILDTPGAYELISGAVSSLYVADSALMLINAQNGVEIGTEIFWRYLEEREKPTIFVVNQLDHDKANFEKSTEELQNKFGSHVIQIQYPVNPGAEFNAIIDVLMMKMLKWNSEEDDPEITDIPEDQKDRAQELHEQLVEAAAESEDELMETFFDEGTLSEEQIMRGILNGITNRSLFPVLCTSATNNTGIKRLMEFLANAAPSPADVAPPKDQEGNEVTIDSNEHTSLFVFKNSFEPHLGDVLFFKLYSGTLEEGKDLINHVNQNKERFSQIFAVAGNTRTKAEKLVAGDIGATVKLKETKINHTLGDKDAPRLFPEIKFPRAKHRAAIKAVNESEDEKMGEALQRLHEEDPTLILEYSKELRQLILHGQGEHHLNTIQWILENQYSVETEFEAPKIPYRETITKGAFAEYRHKKQSGGAGQFAEIYIYIDAYDENKEDPKEIKGSNGSVKISIRDKDEEELPWGGKLVFYNCIVGGVIDNKFMPAIQKGLKEKMEEGPLTGSYARDIRVFVYDGKEHPVDSNEVAFKTAASKAFTDAFKNAGPKIMEPVYKVEVLTPSESMGDVMSDLQGRRAIIEGMNSEKEFERINAKVPLAEMYKYATALSSLSNGRAMYDMEFSEYQQVPPDIQDKLLKAHEEAQQAEE